MDTPVFDPNKDHGTIFSSGHTEEGPQTKYTQNGHHFAADKSYIKSDHKVAAPIAPPKLVPQSTPAPQKDTLPAIEPDEVEGLLQDPRAADLLAKPRDLIAQLVHAANGPEIAGPGSHQSMVAFLIKNTAPDDDEL